MYTTEQLERELDQKTFPLNRYKPLEKLGHGMSGRAFLCFDQFLEEEVVVKTLGAIELDILIDFQREATTLCKIRSKNITQILDFGATASGTVYVVTEFQPGTTLHKYINPSEPPPSGGLHPASILTPELAYRVFIPVAEALALMHANGVLHRDIKSSNILVRNLEAQDSAVYLIDAGTGRVKHATIQPLTFEGRTVTGDPSYLSPEQVLLQQYDARSEIFALGCTFFEALTGRTPFPGQESLALLVRRTPPSLTQASEGLEYHHRLEEFVKKCLQKSPDMRYKTMQEVVYALKELVKTRSSVEHVERFKRPTEGGKPARDKRPSSERKFDVKRDDGSKFALKCQDDAAVRLVDTDQIGSGDSTNQPPLSEDAPAVVTDDTDFVGTSDTISGREQVPTPARQTGSAGQKLAQHSARARAQTNTTGSAGSAQNGPSGSSAIVDPVGNANSQTANQTNAIDIAQDDEDLFARAKKTGSDLAVWCTTSKHRYLAALTLIVLSVCGWLTFSYMSYLTAPRAEVAGLVYAYQPATAIQPGVVELGVDADKGYSKLVAIEIEGPDLNLPDSPPETGGQWSNDLHDSNFWDSNKVNLEDLGSTAISTPVESDSRIGEVWQFQCRKEFGKWSLEKVQYGESSASHRDMQKVHLAISKMYQCIVNAQNQDHSEWITSDWAEPDFSYDVDINPPTQSQKAPDLFPSADMKLLSFDRQGCVMMLRPPSWLTGSKYLTVTLRMDTINQSGWRVVKIENCSESDWERK